jgi:serine-type D-Ala-D-Ala carboxypeptidase (penicillin-binding protein 5/6)
LHKDEIKTKILRILPYWLIFLIITTSLQAAAFLISPNHSTAQKLIPPSTIPRVLGESTSIRGAPPAGGNSTLTKVRIPDLSGISAKSFIVFDLSNGQTLAQKNPDQKLGIASLTKLLTALVVYKNTDLNKTFSVTSQGTSSIRPILGLSAGDRVKALDVFNAMLVGSCNDAALALADFGGTETQTKFVDLMNQEAAGLRMVNSNFSNPVGFDSQYNYSTANDLKILISTTQRLAAFTDLGRRTEYEFTGALNKTYQTTATNKLLLDHPDIQAIKTGYTETAGGAMATSINLNKHQIVIVVLDSPDREGDTLKLKQAIESSFN